MSEFDCPELGCMFHIGIAGDLVSQEDFEAQDYYDQEIEEHQRMHVEQKLDRAIKEAEAKFDAAMGKFDQATRELAFEVCIGGNLSGAREIYLLARDCYESGLGAVESLRNLKKVLSSTQGDEDSTKIQIPSGTTIEQILSALKVGDPPRVEQDVPNAVEPVEERLRNPVNIAGVVQLDRSIGESQPTSPGNDSRDGRLFVPDRNENEPEGGVFVQQLAKSDIDTGDKRVGVRTGLHYNISIEIHGAHQISLSVDGAPDGAGVGTSDSTERGQTPDSPEMKVPSAVAAAEGGETKYPQR